MAEHVELHPAAGTGPWLVAEALFASASGAPPHDRLAWLFTDLEDFLERAGPVSRTLFHVAMMALIWIAPLARLRPPLVWQRLERRIDSIVRIEAGMFAPAVLLVKAVLCVIYYEHPDAERETGY